MSHASDPKVRKGLKQAQGHLASILTMLDEGRSCLDLAQQLQAVERTVRSAKHALIHGHLEHCVADATDERGNTADRAVQDFRALIKYL